MLKSVAINFLVLVALGASTLFIGRLSEASAQERCLVADPTGTPLNVRTVPNGKVVGILSNGVAVSVLDHALKNGKAWVYIGRGQDHVPLGWVFQEYLNCAHSEASAHERCLVADPTGTPLNVRRAPDGPIMGTLSNGMSVEVFDRSSKDGKAWVYVGNTDDRVPIGWVFQEYLDCSSDIQRSTQRDQPIEGYAFEYHDEPARTVSGLDECISSCRHASKCAAYVFFKVEKLCRLMTRSDAILERNPDAVSGYSAHAPSTPAPSAQSPTSGTVVALKNDGGTYVVPVQINGAITLDFVIDSGASDVSVPADVVSTLIRTGTIRDSDFIGKQTYTLADGSEVPSAVFMIRSLKVGNTVIENVKGDVAPAQATLLLGQSFLQHFKSWSINNATHELVLEAQ